MTRSSEAQPNLRTQWILRCRSSPIERRVPSTCVAAVVVEAHADQGVFEAGAGGDGDATAVVEGALASFGGVPVAADRVMDHADDGLAGSK